MDGNNPLVCKRYLIRYQHDLTAAVLGIQKLDLLRDSSPIDRSLLATMVSELGSNILKYARQGSMKICRKESRDLVDIELWAEDQGPGIANIDLALQDHFSTGGSLGLGLPGVKRMADEFWIRSTPDTGTVVFVRKRIQGPPVVKNFNAAPLAEPAPVQAAGRAQVGATYDVSSSVRPCLGHVMSGDAAILKETETALLLVMVDATGHGKVAHANAQRVVHLVNESPLTELIPLSQEIHRELQGTPGAAVGLIRIDLATTGFNYLGVGNIRAAKIGQHCWRGLSRDGVMGSRLPNPYEQRGTLEAGDLLMLWTDGLPELESQQTAKTLSYKSASIIARTLVSKLGKSHDDVGCLVLKWPA
jgi:anti-sigma regulatory factor (Ser/Thr protein kinase)